MSDVYLCNNFHDLQMAVSANRMTNKLHDNGLIFSREASPHSGVERRLFVCDVDGTLLKSDHSLPQAVVGAARRLVSSGIALVLASARSPQGVAKIAREFGASSTAICFNGAWVGSLESRASIQSQALDKTTAQLAFDLTHEFGGAAMWFDERGATATEAGVDLAQPVAAVATDVLTVISSSSSLVGTPLKVLSIFNTCRADDMGRKLRDALGEKALVQRSGSGFVEITHPTISKSYSAEVVRRRLGIRPENTLAAGDAENDIGLLQWANIAITVENAVPAVKAVADYEFPSSDEAGMAKAFRWVIKG